MRSSPGEPVVPPMSSRALPPIAEPPAPPEDSSGPLEKVSAWPPKPPFAFAVTLTPKVVIVAGAVARKKAMPPRASPPRPAGAESP